MQGQTPQLRAGAVNVTGTDDGPGHLACIAVGKLQLAETFLAAVALFQIVVGLFALRELALGRIINKVGGDKNQVIGQVAESRDVLCRIGRFIADAVHYQIPARLCLSHDPLKGGRIVSIGD